MASKFQRQQKRSRWSDAGSDFDTAFLAKVAAMSQDESSSTFLKHLAESLQRLVELRATYAELEAIPAICAAVTVQAGMPAEDPEHDFIAFSLLADLLFLGNSRPIHRQLLNCMRHLPPQRCATWHDVIVHRLLAAIDATDSTPSADIVPLRLSDAIFSLLEHVPIRQKLLECGCEAALYLARGLMVVCGSVGAATSQLSLGCLEDMQDSIGSCYIILQLHGSSLAANGSEKSHRAIVEIADAMLLGLQGSVLPRECLSSAAVTLWLATSLPAVPLPALALSFARGLLVSEGASMTALQLQGVIGEQGLVQSHLARKGTSLAAQLRCMTTMARVCAIKGIFSILPESILLAPFCISDSADEGTVDLAAGVAEGCEQSRWSLVLDGGLLTTCRAVESAEDTHLQHHALAALTIVLQRFSRTLQEEVRRRAESAASTPEAPMPISEGHADGADSANSISSGSASAADINLRVVFLDGASRARVMTILQQHWETPLPQTMKQVNWAFEALLDILIIQQQHAHALGSTEAASNEEQVLNTIAMQLLALGKFRKGRYYPLRALVQRVGALWLLDLHPGLVTSTLQAMEREPICNTASSFLEALLRRLQRDLLAAGDKEIDSSERWREFWVQPLLHTLISGGERLCSNISTYCVPLLLGMDSGGLAALLRSLLGEINAGATPMEDNKIAALVAILKAARQLHLVDDLSEVHCPGEDPIAIPEGLIMRAISHASEALRVDAMHLICIHPKMTLLPGELELKLAARGLCLGMRCSSTNLRNKWTSLVSKLLKRVVVSLRAAVVRRKAGAPSLGPAAVLTADALADEQGMQRQASFLCWLSRTLQASLYPGAPFERKYFALIVLNQLLNAWGTTDHTPPPRGSKSKAPADGSASFGSTYAGLQVFCPGFLGTPGVTSLLEATLDTWDRVREGTVTALSKLPTPLPGFEDPQQAASLATWAQALMSSPRVPDADAGARLMRLIFKKYVLHLKCDLWPSRSDPAQAQLQQFTSLPACMSFLHRLTDQLQVEVELGEQDLAAASGGSLAHGSLLCLRYVLAEVPWASLMAIAAAGDAERPADADTSQVARWLDRLLGLVARLVDITLPCLAQPEETALSAEDVSGTDAVLDDIVDAGEALNSEDDNGATSPVGQLIVTSCWLSLKEAALVLGTLARHAPLEGTGSRGLLTIRHIADMGDLFLRVLTTMKHNGATEKCQAGFLSLTERVLREPTAELQSLPRTWLESLLSFICRPGQTLTDINRRSAGVPYAFVALFLAEPRGSHKVLLRAGLDELLRLANDSAAQSPYPRVHAFNILRMAFLDSELAIDTSGYFAEGMRSAILATAAHNWEVRNAASLAYTSLLVRTLGFKNAQGGSAGAAALSGAEFFQRYPLLHAFFLEQLEAAAVQLETGRAAVHPSLFPILVLLSRLRRSSQTPDSPNAAALSPAAFAPVIRRCLCSRPMGVRQIAALAMAPLVAPTELLAVTLDLVDRICKEQPIKDHNEVNGLLLQLHALLEVNWVEADFSNSLATSIAAPAQGILQVAAATSCAPVAVECLRVIGALLKLLPAASCLDVSGSSEKGIGLAPCSGEQAHSTMLRDGVRSDRMVNGAESSAELARIRLTSATRAACQQILYSRPAEDQYQQQSRQPPDSHPEQNARLLAMQRLSLQSPHDEGDAKEPATDASSPMRSILLQAATQLLLGPLCHPDDHAVELACRGTLHDDAELVLSHPSPGVRTAALQLLVERATAGALRADGELVVILEGHCIREQDAQALSLNHHLMALLPRPKCQAGSLLTAMPDALSTHEAAKQSKLGSEWASLRNKLMHTRDPDERGGALRGLGAAARQLICNMQHDPSLALLLGDFIQDLAACSRATQATSMRLAAQRALQDSGLLSFLREPGAGPQELRQAAMQGWVLALSLMEDEEAMVRCRAASSAGAAILELEGRDSRLAVVELVEQEAMRLLALRCCDLPAFHQHLLAWIYRPSEGADMRRGLGKQQQQQRLYQKDKDNQHEEGLLFAQMAARELQRLLRNSPPPSLVQAVQLWAASVAQDVVKMAAELQCWPSDPWSLAGPTYDAATFLPLFCSITGLVVAAELPQAQQIAPDILTALRDISQALQHGGRHPFLGSVLSAARAAWRIYGGDKGGSLVAEADVLPCFDPDFSLFGLVQEWRSEISEHV